MIDWNGNVKKSNTPTDEELQIIEEELKNIDLNEGFEKLTQIIKTEPLSDAEIELKLKSFSKKDLFILEEMLRVINDPTYICEARRTRELEEDSEHEPLGISFDEETLSINGFGGHGENLNYDYDYDYF